MTYAIRLDPLTEKNYLRVINNENGSIEEEAVTFHQATKFYSYSEALEVCEILDLPHFIEHTIVEKSWRD
jgi:hypothetical protein